MSLYGCMIEIDHGAIPLTVHSRNLSQRCRPRSAQRPAPKPASRAGRAFWFEIDSGNLDAVRIAPHAAPSFGLSPGTQEPATIELSLGRAPAVRIDARVADIIYDGALNAQFLEQGTLSADLGTRPLCRWRPHPTPR